MGPTGSLGPGPGFDLGGAALSYLEVLTPYECRQLREAVHELRPHWTPRSDPPASFFTLGTASYLDAVPLASETYRQRADSLRPLLLQHFGWLYDKTFQRLVDHLDAPVQLAEDKATPGFHIWLTEAIPTEPTASVHFDLQYFAHKWAVSEPGPGDTLSFTLALALPWYGGGLNVWDITYSEFMAAYEAGRMRSVQEAADSRRMTYHPYRLGTMTVHSGQELHQVAPVARLEPGDERITLQGHGVRRDGTWQLYW